MQLAVHADAILIKDSARLPNQLRIESEQFVPEWKLVKNLNGYKLDGMIRKAGWTFFCLAGEVSATVFGINERSMVCRAVEMVSANPKTREFNSLEITRVVSKHFLGVRSITVGARVRHIQESMFLSTPSIEKTVSTNSSDTHTNQTIEITAAEEFVPIG